MNINMPFGIDNNRSWYSIENDAKDGVWPLSYNGVWHTGIHIKASEQFSLLRPLIPGEIVASRICDKYCDSPFGKKYSNSFVLMRHYFGSKRIPFYILYSGLGSKETIEGYQEINRESKKIKKYNEFISYKNAKGEEIYRPIFCRNWTLNNLSVDKIKIEESHLPAFYLNNIIAGYFNRDGKYVFSKTPKGWHYIENRNSFYTFKEENDIQIGFSKQTKKADYFARNGEIDDYDPEGEEKKGIWITLYYDKSFSEGYKKVKINIKNAERIIKKEDNEEYSISIDNRKHLFKTEPFYIIVNKKINTKTLKFTGNGCCDDINVTYYQDDKIDKTERRTYNIIKHYYNTGKKINERNRCFNGDTISILEHIDSDDNNCHQYKVQKTSITYTGYVNHSKYKFSTLYTFDLRYDNIKTNSMLPTHNSIIKIYDEPGKDTNGITIYPSSCLKNNEVYEIIKKDKNYYALIKVYKDSSLIKYHNPALINENNQTFFYGYVKLNNQKIVDGNFSECINASFKKEYTEFNSVIVNDFDYIPKEYNGPIAIFNSIIDDKNLNNDSQKEEQCYNSELHIELFTTSLDDFTFSKKKIQKDGSKVDELIEISSNSKLEKAANEILLRNASFYSRDRIIMYYILNEGFSPLYIKIYEKIRIQIQQNNKGIIIQDKTVKANIIKKNDDLIVIQIKQEVSFGSYKLKKNKYECISDEDGSFYILMEIDDRITEYFIFSENIEKCSKEKPVTLSDDTPIYTGMFIILEKLNSTEKLFTRDKVIAYKNPTFITIQGIRYLRINLNEKYYFIKENDLDDVHIETKYEEIEEDSKGRTENIESSKRYNVFDLPGFILLEDTNEDYICDVKELSERTGLNISPSKQEQNIAKLVYQDKDNDLYTQLTRLVIKAPSMWEEPDNWDGIKSTYIKDLGYWGIEKQSLESLYNYIKNQFFINPTNKNKIFNNENVSKKYYFFHPFRFLEYYADKSIQEFNPYCGEVLIDLPSDSMGGINIVKDSPGFAPKTNGIMNGYPESNGLFNENYLPVSNYYIENYYSFYHEGVDLPANEDTEIISFIYGEIITWGWQKSYGRSTYILDKNRNILYLLAHQHKYMKNIKKGLKIAPGDVVGYVGGSGSTGEGNYGKHLHITKYNLNISSNFMISKLKNSGPYKDSTLKYYKIQVLDWKDQNILNNQRVNPLVNYAKRSPNV